MKTNIQCGTYMTTTFHIKEKCKTRIKYHFKYKKIKNKNNILGHRKWNISTIN